MNYYLAIDIGASSGRHILGSLENGQLNLEEIYRFENGMKKKEGHLVWDTKYLFHEILEGIKKCKEINKIPKSILIGNFIKFFDLFLIVISVLLWSFSESCLKNSMKIA